MIIGVMTGAIVLVGLGVPLEVYAENYANLQMQVSKNIADPGNDCSKCPSEDVKKSDPDRKGHKIKKTPPKKDPPKKIPKAKPGRR